jgi:hypothetical protein
MRYWTGCIWLSGVTLLLWTSSASAAQRVWITEFAGLGNVSGGGQAQIANMPAVARQQVDVTGGVQSSAAFNASTRYIRVVCEVQCAVRGDGTAAATDTLLPAYFPEYFGVVAGSTISVIAAP